MSEYFGATTKRFDRDIKRLRPGSPKYQQLLRTLDSICMSPSLFKPLRNVLKNKHRAHVGSHVVLFEVDEETRTVTFLRFLHHEDVY